MILTFLLEDTESNSLQTPINFNLKRWNKKNSRLHYVIHWMLVMSHTIFSNVLFLCGRIFSFQIYNSLLNDTWKALSIIYNMMFSNTNSFGYTTGDILKKVIFSTSDCSFTKQVLFKWYLRLDQAPFLEKFVENLFVFLLEI
jgi:hypothetical protein